MDSTGVERRLAAIMAMDVVGYSRLMGIDEVGTLNALKAHRGELIDPAIAAHHGRLVKTTGDGLLLEFASVVDAIGAAVAIQRGMLTRNAAVPEDRRIVFRVGVNIGDIIIEGSDIFGDGVNVAARLEALCEPGGVCISRSANEQVRDKLSLSFADLGEHTVKNIARAVGVFGLAAKDIATLPEVPIHPSQAATPASAPSRRRSIAAAAAGLVVVAGFAAWWFGRDQAPPPTFEVRFAAALAKALPAAAEKYRGEVTTGYLKLAQHRAIAVAPRGGSSWRTGDWADRENAEEKALEKCQQFFDEPCALLASGDILVPAGAGGAWPVRDAPRVRYAGLFNPERIPGQRPKDLQRPEVAGYATAAAPKAMAFHTNGVLRVVAAAASQRAAEEQALRACNDDPLRKETGGPCYLYAVENRVVLPLRATAPLAAAVAAANRAPASPAPVALGTAAMRDALQDLIAAAAPSLASATRESQVSGYVEAGLHKAIAVLPPGNSWRTQGQPSAAAAEERVLEACQVRYGGPCVLIAVNDTPQSRPVDRDWPRRAMPRTAYEGLFDPQQVPAVGDTLRQRADVAGYRAKPSPKAVAYHPWGRLFVVTDAPGQRAAEEKALADCNGDPQRNGQAGPCLLYAVVDQVVLPRRLTAPLTTAK